LGLSSGHIRYRKGHERPLGGRILTETESWAVCVSNYPLPAFENISSITHVGEQEVFDIEVDHPKHNFIANDVVVHNSRSPERRVFYVDVGNLPKMKAEQHVRDMMTLYKNKMSYNASTGEMGDSRKIMHMNEDFWMPTRDGGTGTKIDVLAGGQALPDLIQSLEYFQDRLYRALQVPLTRMKPDAVYNLGRATEITRDEVNFSKFIDRVRGKFMELFFQILEKQLILKKIITPTEWQYEIRPAIKYKFARDNYFAELKDLEIMNDRLIRARDAEDFTGKYVSHEWIRRNIFRQTDDDIKTIDKQMEAETSDPRYQQADPGMDQQMGSPQDQPPPGVPGNGQ